MDALLNWRNHELHDFLIEVRLHMSMNGCRFRQPFLSSYETVHEKPARHSIKTVKVRIIYEREQHKSQQPLPAVDIQTTRFRWPSCSCYHSYYTEYYLKPFVPPVFSNKNEAATEPSLFDFGHTLHFPRTNSSTRSVDYAKGNMDKNR